MGSNPDARDPSIDREDLRRFLGFSFYPKERKGGRLPSSPDVNLFNSLCSFTVHAVPEEEELNHRVEQAVWPRTLQGK